MMPVDFQASEHLDLVNAWMLARGRGAVSLAMLPATGLIVEGVAAGFLYRTDSSIGFLDHFVSNPAAPYEARQEAMDALAAGLMALASVQGIRHVVAMTRSDGIRNRALRLGFRDSGESCILTKEISNGLC